MADLKSNLSQVQSAKLMKLASDLFDLLEKFGVMDLINPLCRLRISNLPDCLFQSKLSTEYVTALLASDGNDTKCDCKICKNNAREMGIKILNPDVTESEASFSIPADNTIRFGISALKELVPLRQQHY